MKKQVIYFLVLFIIILLGILSWRFKDKVIGKLQNYDSDNTTSVSSNTSTDIDKVQWQNKAYEIQSELEYTGKIAFNLSFNIPRDWNIQVEESKNPNNFFDTCPKYTITSKDSLSKLILEVICNGGVVQNSDWPLDHVVALQQKRTGNGGPYTLYRARFLDPDNNYQYIDGMVFDGQTIEKTKDKPWNAIIIGYAPPNESKYDFFFISAKLKAEYTGSEIEKENSFIIMDKIAASLALN